MSYNEAKEKYSRLGVDTEKAIEKATSAAISLHRCQGEDQASCFLGYLPRKRMGG